MLPLLPTTVNWFQDVADQALEGRAIVVLQLVVPSKYCKVPLLIQNCWPPPRALLAKRPSLPVLLLPLRPLNQAEPVQLPEATLMALLTPRLVLRPSDTLGSCPR